MGLENPYCTVEQVQEELRSDDESLRDTLIESINQASRWIDDYKGFDFYLHDHSSSPLEIDQYDGVIDGATLYLPYFPIILITSVTVAGTLWVAGTDYVVKPTRRIVALGGSWPLSGADKVSIVGKFGYAQNSASEVPAIPPFINKAAVLVAAAFSGHNQKEIVAVDGSKSEVIDKNIPKVVLTILGSRRIVI